MEHESSIWSGAESSGHRQDASSVALARSWIERKGLALPMEFHRHGRWWQLTALDVELAFLYYFAARAQAMPVGTQLFPSRSGGNPHILTLGYPHTLWKQLSRAHLGTELRSLPPPTCVPPLEDVATRIRERYGRKHLLHA